MVHVEEVYGFNLGNHVVLSDSRDADRAFIYIVETYNCILQHSLLVLLAYLLTTVVVTKFILISSCSFKFLCVISRLRIAINKLLSLNRHICIFKIFVHSLILLAFPNNYLVLFILLIRTFHIKGRERIQIYNLTIV